MTYLVALNGILKSENNTPIPEGRFLFEALRAQGRTVILLDEPRKDGEYWLRQQGILGIDDILDNSLQLNDGESLRVRQVNVARSLGRVHAVVDSNPEVIAKVFSMGVTGILFAKPESMLPSYRPDGKKSWKDIEAAIEKQRGLKEEE